MLKSVDRDTYGDGYDATLLEQWKTCVEMANSNTEKRNNANSLFITINAALFTVVTFAGDYKSILLSAIGSVVCIHWLTSIATRIKYTQVAWLPSWVFTAEPLKSWKKWSIPWFPESLPSTACPQM